VLILKNCRLVPELVEGYEGNTADIAIEGNLIQGIYSPGEAPAGEEMDLHGMTVLPGLFDLHMHLNFDSMNVEAIASREPEQAIIDGLDYAQEFLRNGYTYLRDCGIAHWSGRYVRQAIDRGIVVGPHYSFSGACNSASAPGNKQFGPVYREFDGPQYALRICREDVANGADFVKYMVTGAVMNQGGDPQAMLCTEEELQAMADGARACGTYLSCHCHGKPGILACIRSGVYTVEHCTYIDEECIEAFLQADGASVIIPTMGVIYGILMDDTGAVPEYMKTRSKEIYDRASENLGKAYRAGVKMGWGSDADRVSFHKYPGLEFIARRKMGLTNVELLKQATIDSAKIVHVDHLAGTIKCGKWADLCVIDGNPDEDIDVMTKLPAHVFIQGKAFV